MIENDESKVPPPAPAPQDEALARSYDFFKHLTGICLVSIGGVLGLLQGQASDTRGIAVLTVIVSLSMAGLLSMTMVSSIATLGYKGPEATERMYKSIPTVQVLIVLLLVFGLGAFVGIFVQDLLP